MLTIYTTAVTAEYITTNPTAIRELAPPLRQGKARQPTKQTEYLIVTQVSEQKSPERSFICFK